VVSSQANYREEAEQEGQETFSVKVMEFQEKYAQGNEDYIPHSMLPVHAQFMLLSLLILGPYSI
jgi:hypothetical protein